MSNARAQFKLPYNCRNVIDTKDFYYFGPYMAGRDMKPIAFDRVLPQDILQDTSHYSPLTLSGTGVNLAYSHPYIERSVNAAQSLFSDSGINTVFKSQSGLTSGRSFVVAHKGQFCEIKENGELENVGDINIDGGIDTYLDFSEIIDENLDYMFVVSYSRRSYYNDDREVSQRIHIAAVSKSTFTASIRTDPSDDYNDSYQGRSHYNKGVRYLGKMDDGKHLFVVYRTKNISNYADGTWYMVLDTSSGSGSIDYSDALDNQFSNNICSVPSNLLKSRATEGVLGSWFFALPNAVDDVTFIRREVDSVFASGVPKIPSAEGNPQYTVCTLSNMPEGVSITTPATTDNSSIEAQISMWTVEDNGKEYLIYYGHNGGDSNAEDSQYTPASRHTMFVFEIDPLDSSNLIYRNHIPNAFDYSQQLPGFCLSVDRKTVIVCNTKGFGILSWSSDAQSYVVSPWRSVPGIERLTFDESSQIWVEDSSHSVYVFNPDLSASVIVQFENGVQSMLYSGEPLTVNALINVYSFVGDRIARNVRLHAKGCTFDDGTTTKDITTLADGDTYQPLIINGQGNVTVDAFLI